MSDLKQAAFAMAGIETQQALHCFVEAYCFSGSKNSRFLPANLLSIFF
jgi:hypothetical protein